MVRRRFFAHVSPGGSDLSDRLRRAGAIRGDAPFRFGEVLGWGTLGASSPRRLVRAWLDSPPHRGILLDRRYDEAGVGVAHGSPATAGTAALTATMVLAG